MYVISQSIKQIVGNLTYHSEKITLICGSLVCVDLYMKIYLSRAKYRNHIRSSSPPTPPPPLSPTQHNLLGGPPTKVSSVVGTLLVVTGALVVILASVGLRVDREPFVKLVVLVIVGLRVD